VLDGRNQYLGDGVQRALGREPNDFAEFAQRIAARGIWDKAEAAA
ncbi:MAG: NmrA family transcriptional regulator, partial [Gammaproteobacteria bacterium]